LKRTKNSITLNVLYILHEKAQKEFEIKSDILHLYIDFENFDMIVVVVDVVQ